MVYDIIRVHVLPLGTLMSTGGREVWKGMGIMAQKVLQHWRISLERLGRVYVMCLEE